MRPSRTAAIHLRKHFSLQTKKSKKLWKISNLTHIQFAINARSAR
jgi:hypothetical protein